MRRRLDDPAVITTALFAALVAFAAAAIRFLLHGQVAVATLSAALLMLGIGLTAMLHRRRRQP